MFWCFKKSFKNTQLVPTDSTALLASHWWSTSFRRFKMGSLVKSFIKLGCLLAFPLKRSCDTISKLCYSNSSFRAVFASISLSHFKCFVSWPSRSKTFIDSCCRTYVFLNNFIVLTLTISVVVWRKGLQKYFTRFAKYFQKKVFFIKKQRIHYFFV